MSEKTRFKSCKTELEAAQLRERFIIELNKTQPTRFKIYNIL